MAAVIGGMALLAMLFVQGYIGGGDSEELAEFAEARGAEPAELVVAGAGSRRIIVIGDVPGRAEPKRLVRDVLRRFGESGGADALVVDVDSAHQLAFDRYTATTPEDASILTRATGLLPAGESGRQALELYRAVWEMNQELGADRRMRILAVAPGAWPPAAALPPKVAAETYAARGVAMADRIGEQALARTSRSRVVVLVDALQALRVGHAELRVGGGGAIASHWLAATLAQRYPVDVYTVLPDVSLDMAGYPLVAQYAGTRVHERLTKAIPSEALGLPVAGPIAEFREPLLVRTGPGVSISILPLEHTLADLADAYVFLPQ
jgi:hypothetical protein